MAERLPETGEMRGDAFMEVRTDGGPLEKLFARLALSLGTSDCWFDVGVGGRPTSVRITCASPENRRFVAKWLHAMRAAEIWEAGRKRPVFAVPKAKQTGKKGGAQA